jgi:hypothetical protein
MAEQSTREELPKGHSRFRNKTNRTEVFYVDREKVSVLPRATAVMPDRYGKQFPKVLEQVVVTEATPG